MKNTAIYPGSFDPFTNGHLDTRDQFRIDLCGHDDFPSGFLHKRKSDSLDVLGFEFTGGFNHRGRNTELIIGKADIFLEYFPEISDSAFVDQQLDQIDCVSIRSLCEDIRNQIFLFIFCNFDRSEKNRKFRILCECFEN